MPDEHRPLKVFLCHAHADREAVRALYNRLTKDGVDAWLDKEKLLPGQDWELEIRKAVRDADVVVVCLSQQFNQAGFRQKEVRLALDTAMEQPEGDIFIIPARLDVSDTLESLRKWHWVDLFENDGYEMLMRALRARADKVGATLQMRRSWLTKPTSSPKDQKIRKNATESKQDNAIAVPPPNKTTRKPNMALTVALIGFAGTIIAGLLSSPLIGQWFLPEVEPTASVTATITVFPTAFQLHTLEPNSAPISTSTLPPTPLLTEIKDTNGVSMMPVPAGEFTMGGGDGWNADEQIVNQVYLDAFYIDKFEVTNAMYKDCVNAGVCEPPRGSNSSSHPLYYDHPSYKNYPVIYVTWQMAKTYCEWRGARLPTEAEWEKSARGTDERHFPWGQEKIGCERANYRQTTGGLCVGDTSAVGSRPNGASPYGVHDLAGNVAEWVSSLYMPYPYHQDDGREDPEEKGDRVVRGGNWANLEMFTNSINRTRYDSIVSSRFIGFRCAMSIDP